MFLKIMAITTILIVLIASGCGLAIHNKWVGEMVPRPHIVLGGLVILFSLATAIAVLTTT
ncbi:MAG: hypothetical protein MUO76_19700 [Anaerolineaceae bacterium]|nr:hypothetical protein [Anaerolineaceae bacterium]